MSIDTLNLSRMHFPVTTLGPGKRIGIWFQGCSLKCAGCISVDTWKTGKGRIAIKEIYTQIESWASEANGITISGGEPFEQFEALKLILGYIKSNHSNLSVLVYSGFSFESLREKLRELEGLIDALISEPFLQSNPSSHPLMGSANQKLHFLSPCAEKEFSGVQTVIKQPTNKVDATFKEDQLWMTGILKQGGLEKLAEHLEKQGHKIIHTQHSDRNTKRI